MMIKECSYCKKEFKTDRKNAKYCTHECYIKEKLSKRIVCYCDYCGKELHLSNKDFNRSKKHFCNKICSGNAHCGENNSSFNPNLSEEDRVFRRRNIAGVGYTKFRRDVLKRDNYTCQVTGLTSKETTLEVHHLDGYDLNKEKRVDTSNGITLSKEIHSLFHKIYGYGNNTLEQFKEFAKNYKTTCQYRDN